MWAMWLVENSIVGGKPFVGFETIDTINLAISTYVVARGEKKVKAWKAIYRAHG